MPHIHRFHVPAHQLTPPLVALPDEEAHHAARVVRVKTGDPVLLFDGEGRECDGTIAQVSRRDVVVAIEAERRYPPPDVRVTLFQAWLLREKAVEFLIRHGTETGISRFVFFRGGHSEQLPRPQEKWRRIAIEACKQCGRVWLPSFVVHAGLDAALDAEPMPILLATRDGNPVSLRQAMLHRETGVIVGPEGGLTEEEHSLAMARGATPITLGNVTYRAEMAGIVAALLITHELSL
ncbi:MAG TPA: RsmE family RNA methyltransferase [Candidatus Hydrogenedentes bacterium]|nr:RsmE family RNA methyltransferase [Candidatus Hydrogenedentota bacterium]HPC16540.1 RsmE family RNA methyltransferase [Candidatus Hydrogenedentota bacterium]HRT18961.1 RsmE family RNA methyltransferase [Candidatus Hydrogenedentota bacterium]HRT64927.1 RsmE family RNA methyltransferase [Candidatus Hydrogenedentota bacterium]